MNLNTQMNKNYICIGDNMNDALHILDRQLPLLQYDALLLVLCIVP